MWEVGGDHPLGPARWGRRRWTRTQMQPRPQLIPRGALELGQPFWSLGCPELRSGDQTLLCPVVGWVSQWIWDPEKPVEREGGSSK